MTNMTAVTDHRSLDDLRQEIDTIDTRMHDLLMQRADLVAHIAHAKAMSNKADQTLKIPVRPDREMAIMRTLVDRHSGPLPPQVVVRIWREIVTAMSQMQAPFSVCVASSTPEASLWDQARDFFGSVSPLSLSDSSHSCLQEVAAGRSTFAVLPNPKTQETDTPDTTPWWPLLTQPEMQHLHIVGCLPIFEEEGPNGFIVAPKDLVPIDPDVHFVATSAPAQDGQVLATHEELSLMKVTSLPNTNTEAMTSLGGYFLGPQI